MRPSGIALSMPLLISAVSAWVMSVSMKPGATALTVMSRDAYSRASVLASAEQRGLRRRVGRLPGVAHLADDARQEDHAPVCGRASSPWSRRARSENAPPTLTRELRSMSSSLRRSRRPSMAIPALATRMSRRPSRLATAAMASSEAFGVGDVEADDLGLAAAGHDAVGDFSGLRLALHVVHDDVRPLLGERLGDGPADAARAARYDCDLFIEPEHWGRVLSTTERISRDVWRRALGTSGPVRARVAISRASRSARPSTRVRRAR